MRIAILLAALAAPAGAVAQAGCPVTEAPAEAQSALIAQLRSADGPGQVRTLTGQLWALWLDAPDALAQDLLDRGMALREAFDFAGSRAVLTRLTDYCPDYAEGWNQRAFAAFLARDFEASLADLERALALNPEHVAALSGKGLTLLEMGRTAEGQAALRAALELNPWLAERRLLDDPPGTDL